MPMPIVRVSWRRGVLAAVTAAAMAGAAGLAAAAPAMAWTEPQGLPTAVIAQAEARAGISPAIPAAGVVCPLQDLQAAIDMAPPDGVLVVAGRCTGNFYIGKNLTVIGAPGVTHELNGGRAGTTLTILGKAHVRLFDLVITGGAGGTAGGGIENNSGSVTLSGSTVVGNSSFLFGGGISNGPSGMVNLIGSRVEANTARSGGGGISNMGGTVILIGSTVVGNTVPIGAAGGGIRNMGGTVLLSDSLVRYNTPDNCSGYVPGCMG
jgi:hypothetical protein